MFKKLHLRNIVRFWVTSLTLREGVSSRPSVTQTPMFLGLAHHFATQRADHVIEQLVDVRFWHKADIATALTDVRFWG